MSEFQIAETKGFAKRKANFSPKLYEKIKSVVYPQLRKNPYFGPNIKKLKGELAPSYRFCCVLSDRSGEGVCGGGGFEAPAKCVQIKKD